MISFVVIGRNQEGSVGRCLASVFDVARVSALPSFEVIYVDSKSTDDSVASVRSRYGGGVRVVLLTGETNAGIARNIGASVATGDILFFIDGDVELDTGFLADALDAEYKLVHPVVTGQLPECLYDQRGRYLGTAPDCYRIFERGLSAELGGIFLIDKVLFSAVGGFAAELRVNEDHDLGLRVARGGSPVLRIPKPIGIHHTVQYFDYARLVRMVANGSWFFAGVTFRRHLANPWYWPLLLSHQRPTAVLVMSLALAAVFTPAWLGLYAAYIVVKNLRRPGVSFLQDLVGTAVRSVCFLVGVCCFFPHPISAGAIRYEILA